MTVQLLANNAIYRYRRDALEQFVVEFETMPVFNEDGKHVGDASNLRVENGALWGDVDIDDDHLRHELRAVVDAEKVPLLGLNIRERHGDVLAVDGCQILHRYTKK